MGCLGLIQGVCVNTRIEDDRRFTETWQYIGNVGYNGVNGPRHCRDRFLWSMKNADVSFIQRL